MKTRHLAMGAAVLVLGGLVLFGEKGPAGEVVEPIARSAAPRSAGAAKPAPLRAPAGAASEPVILALAPRERSDAAAAPPGPFGNQDWNPPPPPPPSAAQLAAAAPPPSAPPLPFTYIGKAAADGRWEVFLARADKTYIVQAKTVIDGTYRVDAITPPTLTMTYLPLNQVQQLNIGVLD